MADLEVNFLIRPFRPEDVDYVVSGHKEMYGRDYGFNSVFDEYVEKAVKAFHENRDAEKEQMWVAEWAGKPAGAIAIVKAAETTAQLRWFFVDPEARGRGIGGELIKTALNFCRENGYRTVILWTVDRMASARRMYEAHGFVLTESKPNNAWTDGELTEEKWELAL
jgi:GNAT superfamily N-acetyltransferase